MGAGAPAGRQHLDVVGLEGSAVPLSEHEQRLLDQIERALYQEDPKFASTVRSTDLRSHMRRRLRRAGVVLAIGFLMLLAGPMINSTPLGILGFIVMIGALILAMASWRRLGGNSHPTLRVVGGEAKPVRSGRTGKGARPRASGSWPERLEERWRRRWEERGR